MRSSSSERQTSERCAQSSRVGVRSSGSAASASRIVASGIPTRCAARMNATRRSVSREYRRWLPEVRRLLISPFDS